MARRGPRADTLAHVNDTARRERRAQARRRSEAQRRRVMAAAGTGIVLGLVVIVLVSVGGVPGGEGNNPAAAEPKPPPQLPRGGRSVFPEFRVVGFAGAPQDEALGALGVGSLDQAARRLERQARPYTRGPGRRPVLPAFELIAVIANASAGDDGEYRTRQEKGVVREYLAGARRAGALLMLDVQPGRADFLEEVRYFDEFLAQPDVTVALDPEWHMAEGEVPGQTIGSVTAEEVNEVAAHLSRIVQRGRLPEKMLVVHQFTLEMIEDRSKLKRYPGVELVLNVDGVGDPKLKIDKYNAFMKRRDRARNGFKVFYEEDTNRLSPAEVMRLRPEPEFVVYE